jgi:hypothetical protein
MIARLPNSTVNDGLGEQSRPISSLFAQMYAANIDGFSRVAAADDDVFESQLMPSLVSDV